MKLGSLSLVMAGSMLICSLAQARPEYALRMKMNCVSCHVLPTGSGPRNVFGKHYGSRDFTPSPLSNSDLYTGDFRSLFYYPTQRTTHEGNGLALMVAAATANVPIQKHDDGSTALQGVLTVDFGSLSNGTREAVLVFNPKSPTGWTPSHIMFGKFYVPYGLLTDEHRTYTRIQNKTSYRDYEMGANFTWDTESLLHFDLALTNGFQSGGQLTVNDLTYAVTPNVRWNPPSLPILLGASANYHRTVTRGHSPYAYSAYGGLSFYRLTQDKIPATLLFEAEFSRYWNNAQFNDRLNFFYPSAGDAYLAAIRDSQSLGLYGWLRFDLSKRFNLIYKLDRFTPDKRYVGDTWWRNGLGFEWYPSSNTILNARYEIATTPERGTNPQARAAQDVFLAMFRVWI